MQAQGIQEMLDISKQSHFEKAPQTEFRHPDV